MKQDTMVWPTMEELEGMLFHQLQEQFAAGMKHILESMDEQLMEQRDKTRISFEGCTGD